MVKFLKKSKVFRYWPYLLGLFIIALILRVSGINFGLPYSYHYDILGKPLSMITSQLLSNHRSSP
jgi:hypothetical protein